MNILLCPSVVIILAVLPLTSCQDPVPIQFQSSPVLVATGDSAVFTLQTISDIFSIAWFTPAGRTLGQWINNQAVLNSIAQYQGRVTITATKLTISNSQLNDAGSYRVTVTPSASTGLSTSSLSVRLSVYVAVGTVSLIVPSVTLEGGNASLTCSWTVGTNTSVTWAKDNTALPSDPHFSFNAGSLVINPVNRDDAGEYRCTVSNPVSSQASTSRLTVYYGPDTPEVTKASSDCVGGGDTIVGQTLQLTCTSVSLPAALLSWEFGGVPLTASQANDGTLNLQIFSTNQSGQYTCSARNSITTKTSQQQISIRVVGVCLGGGAVAGIVIACFVALVLIILAIVLLLRQRNVDQRIRTVIGQRKENLNNRPTVLPAPQNGHDNFGYQGQIDQPDPPLHHQKNANRSKNHQSLGQNNNNNDILTQNRIANTNAIQGNGQLTAGMFSNNVDLNADATLHNSQRNTNSHQHNADPFQQGRQQNPNILIQTGNAEAGPHTVLINLNALPQHRNATTQPQTVQVSLNGPSLASAQPDQNTMQYNDQQRSTVQQDLGNTNQNSRLLHVNGAHSSPQSWRNADRNTTQPAQNSTLRNSQARSHHNINQTPIRQNPRDTNPYPGPTRSVSDDESDPNTHRRQRPWDRIRGTPAYPNPQVGSYESQNYIQQNSSSDTDGGNIAPTRRPMRYTMDEPVRNISRGVSRRNFLRELAHTSSLRRSRVDRNTSRQVAQPDLIAQPHVEHHQNQTASENIAPQRHGIDNMNIADPVPQIQPIQIPTAQPTRVIRQGVPENRQNEPHNAPVLTEATLQQHTRRTANVFANRNQQTQAALLHPGTQSGPARTQPARQTNKSGQVAPPPPPILHLSEFKRLPRDHVQRHPANPVRRPVVTHHGHRPPNMPRHAKAMRSNLHKHPANPHVRAHAQWHGNRHGVPAHINQAHRIRTRP